MARRRTGAQNSRPEVVRIWLLGGFGISVGSRVVEGVAWRRRKAASLLKLLALAEGHRLHREQATALLWPDLDAKSAANNLHRTLHVARAALEPDAANNSASRYLTLRGILIELCPDGPLWVDVEAFEEAAATARRASEPAAYQAALVLYAGELLPEDRYEAWAEERREALRETYLALLTGLAELHEERAEYEPAIEALRRALNSEPAREEAHRGLMRLFAASGERRRAIAQYARLEKALSELGAEPADSSRRLHEEIAANRFPKALSRSGSRVPKEHPEHNLPNARTSFVGREKEMVEVKRSLSMTGVLTLTGTGGSGKTRLALEVARDLVGTYPDGVWLVELAPLSEGALVPNAVAATFGVREQPGRPLMETLTKHLGSKRTLLVLDNCEHLVGACARLVDALLNSCSGLRVLATSREALEVAGETNWPVSPLALPDAERRIPPVGELARYEAVGLFLERARSRLPDFELTEENARWVVEVCRKLDGIPLGIELATARMSALAMEQIAARLNDSLGLLTTGPRTADPRHKTLRATLAWSHDLLDEPERELFGRLSVFAGGWTLEAAEGVCSGNGIEQDDVLDLLSRLVDKSLVVAESAAGGAALRYRMLEPVRQYGREKLEASGETEQILERHATYFLALAERVEPELYGARPVQWLGLLEAEYANLQASLSWALDADEVERAETGLRLAAALGRFWDAHGSGEGRRWLEKGLAKSGSSSTSVRAKALNEAGFIAVYEGDLRAMALLEEGLALNKKREDRSGLAASMSSLGHAVVHLDDRERMLSLREEVEALLQEPLDRRETAHLLQFLGIAAAGELDFEQMEARLEEALAMYRDLGDVRSIAMCLIALGLIPLSQGDGERAAVLYEESLLLQKELNKTAIMFGLAGMAGVAALRGQQTRVAKLMGASDALREVLGLSRAPLSLARYDREGYLANARAALGEAAFEAALSEGQAMPPDQAVEYALSTEEPSSPVTSKKPPRIHTDNPADLLTRRQREVALLIGRGLTNAQIADDLAISKNTVANHVARILKNLDLPSRSQIAVWVTESRLRDVE